MYKNTLDVIDEKIIELLRENSRLSFREIAEKLGKTESTIRRRVKKLIDAGIIKKFTIITSASRSGHDIYAFVRITTSPEKLDTVAREVVKFDEVKQAYYLAGQCGVALIVRVPNVETLNSFIREKLAEISGVLGIETCIILQELKHVLEV